ncbi:hypothetical protein E2493_13295 [Sphingomonas parva]|uniref:DUF5681 domain-containing protein n=1 Tax=Sphingomonas parva TaxID=2555898 RepID=A0A4Y8ZTK7_9SPHN|nr:DUF5681 domain-containing protein [Sphingomonas parva]TFI57796.1 hypothetical protein E2493_13295 [Sphingomonas parva]
MTEMSAIRSDTGRFPPGRSGNPAGRPLRSRNRASRLAELIDEAESAAIVRAMVDRALAGDGAALRACFTRLLPRPREAAVEIDLPPVACAADVCEASTALIAAVASGDISPREAQQVMRLLTAHLKLLAAARGEAPAAAPPPKPSSRYEDRLAMPPDPDPGKGGACISPVSAGAPPPVPDAPAQAARVSRSSRDRTKDAKSETGGRPEAAAPPDRPGEANHGIVTLPRGLAPRATAQRLYFACSEPGRRACSARPAARSCGGEAGRVLPASTAALHLRPVLCVCPVSARGYVRCRPPPPGGRTAPIGADEPVTRLPACG